MTLELVFKVSRCLLKYKSLSNTESQRGRVAERRRKELGRDRPDREGEGDKEERQRIGKALEE